MTDTLEHKLTEADLRRANLPEEFWHSDIKKCSSDVQRYIRNYWENGLAGKGVGLLLHGPSGVGKTAVASLLLKKARSEFKTVYFTRVGELRENLRAEAQFDLDQTVAARIYDVDVLVLDGLSDAYFNGWPFNLADAVDLIATRGSRRKVTHVTTSCWQKLTSAREKFVDEVGVYTVPVLVDGEDWRAKQVQALTKAITGEG